MKRICITQLVASLAAFAGGNVLTNAYQQPLQDVLWENPYSLVDLHDGMYSSGSFYCQDDFQLTEDAIIEGFECWSAFQDGPMGDFQLTVYDDDAGSPGDQLWQAVPSSVANTDTGDNAWGFDLYHTIMDLDSADFFQAASGTTYWVEIYGTGTSIFYWLCADGGNMHRDGTDLGYDAFFRVLGTVNTAIHQSS